MLRNANNSPTNTHTFKYHVCDVICYSSIQEFFILHRQSGTNVIEKCDIFEYMLECLIEYECLFVILYLSTLCAKKKNQIHSMRRTF